MGINNNNNKDLEVDNMNFLDRIIQYEDGQMEWDEIVSFFQDRWTPGLSLTCKDITNEQHKP